MTGGEQHRRSCDGPCEAVALGKKALTHVCPFWGRYEGLYGLVLCGHHLRVYERAVTVARHPRPWRDRLRGLSEPPEPVVAPAGSPRGVYQGFYAA